ncbi:conserved hypothetical protein [Ricinus communis]|uniref:Uncharacterized protein n=1 Tax=Ricinus communis TaxID=3988 RepID=B9SJX9_RICCO|nr:conserved hypothetical protein [Ricinus communis]
MPASRQQLITYLWFYDTNVSDNVSFCRQEKQIRYAPRKARTDVRKHIKGRVVKKEDYDSDTVDVTRSY